MPLGGGNEPKNSIRGLKLAIPRVSARSRPNTLGWRKRFFPLEQIHQGELAFARYQMAAVAQLVEPRIVIPVVAGSSPVGRPIF